MSMKDWRAGVVLLVTALAVVACGSSGNSSGGGGGGSNKPAPSATADKAVAALVPAKFKSKTLAVATDLTADAHRPCRKTP